MLLGVYLYQRWTAVPETKATAQKTSSTTTSAPPPAPPIEEWPSDSPSMPVALAIPGSDVRIGGLQFFSASPNPPPVEGRNFSNVFEHSNSDRIYWQLNLEHPQHAETQTFDLVVYLYGPDGSLRTRNKSQFSLEKGWTNSRLSNWWVGAISTWPMGEYAVSVFVNGAKVSSNKFEIQTAAVEPTQAANTPPPAPIQPEAKPIAPGSSPSATDATAQQSDPRQDATSAVPTPPATEAPLAQYQASHQVAGPDKKGFLTFWHGAFRFDSTNDPRPDQTFVIRREQVQFPHQNGVQVFGGKRYHFNVQGMTKEQVSDLFGRWYQGQ
jgi:hypothetical protein